MIKEILYRFNHEAENSASPDELNGYYYATLDMLCIVRTYHMLSEVTHRFLVREIKVIRALIMYKKFNNVHYINRLERFHEM